MIGVARSNAHKNLSFLLLDVTLFVVIALRVDNTLSIRLNFRNELEPTNQPLPISIVFLCGTSRIGLKLQPRSTSRIIFPESPNKMAFSLLPPTRAIG